MKNKYSTAFDFAVMVFILAGGLYFLYYLVQFNKLGYLLFSFILYLISFFIRHYVIKEKNTNGFSELGMFFISMVFLAYSLYIFKLDEQVTNYLPDTLLENSGAAFILLVILNMMPNRKSGIVNFLSMLIVFAIIVFRDTLNLIFQIFPWMTTLIIGVPYIYLLMLLSGTYKARAPSRST